MSPVITKQEVAGTKQENPEIALQKLAQKVSTDVTKSVLDVVLTQLSLKSTEILDRVESMSRPREIIVGIKVNDKDLKKLKHEPHPDLPQVVNLLLNGLTPLLVGPAGCGKTFLGEQAAETLGLKYGHLCFSAGVSETWLFGRQTPHGFIEGEFSKLYKNGGLFLADELDAADSNLLLTINTALANGHLYNPISGENITRHKDFYFIATANTFGKGGNSVYTGRSRLDAATLDRFTCYMVDYLQNVEDKILTDKSVADWLRSVRNYLKEINSNEVVSYRAFDKANKLLSAGFNMNEISTMLFASFPEQVKSNLPKIKEDKKQKEETDEIPF